MGTFTFDGLSVHYLDEGAGDQAVVFIHGFPFDSSMWEPQIPVAVAAGRRAVVPDLVGFGQSDVPADRSAYSIDRYADLVAALISDLGLGRVVVAGLSMGGYIALAIARRHPDVLAGLVLADTRADPDTAEGRQTRADNQTVVEEKGDVTPLVDGLLERILSEGSPRHDEARLRLSDVMRATAPAGWIGALEAMKNRRDQTDLLPAISVPTLVVVGDSDALVPLDVAERMAKAIPGSRLEVVPGAGHIANLESPEVFNRVFAEFLAALSPARP
ncbi:MAG TPA: alpha/beta fold hydrolase [Acidimicrobiia bacterium]|nr:alpha/beta fold hydrolase [Acidimicrobiia bacterium]